VQELLEANPAVKLLSLFEDVVVSAGGVPDMSWKYMAQRGRVRNSELWV
jgi:hypothetical protein